MEKIREIVAYKYYFEDFLTKQPIKVQDKIFKILEAIETLERIPSIQKKTHKTPKSEIEKAITLMNEYYGNRK